MSWRKKTILFYGIVLSILASVFVFGLLAQASMSDEITGYVINNGTAKMYTQQLAMYEVTPFIYSAQSAQQYLDHNKYTTDLSFKKIYIMTGAFDVYDPNNAGCVFLFTSDGYSYYITSHALGEYHQRQPSSAYPYYSEETFYPKCKAEVPDGPGFSKQNFLSVDLTGVVTS